MQRFLPKLKPIANEPRREHEPRQRVTTATNGTPPPRRRVLNEAAHKLHH